MRSNQFNLSIILHRDCVSIGFLFPKASQARDISFMCRRDFRFFSARIIILASKSRLIRPRDSHELSPFNIHLRLIRYYDVRRPWPAEEHSSITYLKLRPGKHGGDGTVLCGLWICANNNFSQRESQRCL